MANKTVSYANLKLKVNSEVRTFEYDGQEIEVRQYLGMSDKCDLIAVALQKAEENGVYNPALLDMFFHLNIVYLYTNLSFTDKQKEDEFKIYDTLRSNGILDKVIENMNETEYNELFTYMDTLMNDILQYHNTAGAVLQTIIQDLPKNAAIAKDIVENFDKTKYQEVINFATAANGGRSVITNESK